VVFFPFFLFFPSFSGKKERGILNPFFEKKKVILSRENQREKTKRPLLFSFGKMERPLRFSKGKKGGWR
jgi:hypothetical protein